MGGLWAEFSTVETPVDFHEAMLLKKRKIEKYNAQQRRIGVARYFANLNTLEFILLGCGIIVCLAGVLFQSAVTDRRALVSGQVRGVAWFVLIVIIVSLTYYFMFFLAELAPYLIGRVYRFCYKIIFRRKPKSKHDEPEEYYDPEIVMDTNPVFGVNTFKKFDTSDLQNKIQEAEAKLRREEMENTERRKELAKKKIENQLEETKNLKVNELQKDVTNKKQFKGEQINVKSVRMQDKEMETVLDDSSNNNNVMQQQQPTKKANAKKVEDEEEED